LDIHVYWNILTMHGPINVKSPNNTSKWQMGFNSAFKGLIYLVQTDFYCCTEKVALIISLVRFKTYTLCALVGILKK
jgi:hypothetical protein